LINTKEKGPNNAMNFASFCFFHNIYRLYHKYSIENTLQINETELLDLLQDDLIPYAITNAIDNSVANFTQAELAEAVLFFQKQKPDETEFFYSFKQVNKPSFDFVHDELQFYKDLTPNKGKPNQEARHIFYTTMTDISSKYWTKFTLYKAFHLANMFLALSSNYQYKVQAGVLIAKINDFYDTVNPPFGFLQRRNYLLYKYLPGSVYLDLITFLQVEVIPLKFRVTTISDRDTINEAQVKSILKDYGLIEISDLVIDQALVGYDKFQRRIYNSLRLIGIIITVRSVAAELQRSLKVIEKDKLKITKSLLRTFPIPKRRLTNSTLV